MNKHKFLIAPSLIISIIALDQWSKWAVFRLLDQHFPPFIEVTPFFNLVKVYNYGISFGMLNNIAGGQYILSFVAIVIVGVLIGWLAKTPRTLAIWALALVIGGAVGNIIDRVRIGAVADFLDFYMGNYHWPAFNVADSAVFIGVVLLLIDGYLEHKDEKKQS